MMTKQRKYDKARELRKEIDRWAITYRSEKCGPVVKDYALCRMDQAACRLARLKGFWDRENAK